MIESWQSSLQLVLIIALVVGSTWTWADILLRRANGMPLVEPHEQPVARVPMGVVLGGGAWIAFQFLGTLVPPGEPVPLSLPVVLVMCGINFLIAAVMPLALAVNGRRPAEFGITFENWPRQIGIGVKAFLAAVWPTALLLFVSLAWRSVETQHPYLKALRDPANVELIVWVVVSAALAAPLAEEMLFRVTLQSWLSERLPAPLAVGSAAVAFVLVHDWRDSLPLLPLALILGYVFHRTHSYWACVVAHSLFNSANLALALLSEFPADA